MESAPKRRLFSTGPRLILFGIVLTIGLGAGALYAPLELPEQKAPVRLVDRNGALLAERPVPEQAVGRWVVDFPANVITATLAAEDHRFEGHWGVDPLGIARAAWENAKAGEVVQGGSTITQQLVRNLWARPAGMWGKIWEAWLALRIEATHSKDRILEEYLNRIYYGNHAYGIDAAARVYLDKSINALSTAEAALLVALPRKPVALDPWRHPTHARTARNQVIDRMEQLGKVEAVDAQQAREQPLGLRERYPWYHAPHFVRRLSATAEGDVQTTLDFQLQQKAKRVVEQTVLSLEDWGVTQAAALIVDNKTAEVLAYVGSADWRASDGQVDGVSAQRSPGSTLKPFVYGLALEQGESTLATVLADLPTSWSTTHGTWSPDNYDHRFHGPVLFRNALARSLNIPAARLLEQVGVANLLQRLRALGVTSLNERPDHYGLGLTLGDGEVQLDELVTAYLAIANQGRARPLVFLRDSNKPVRGEQVMDERVAWLLLDTLDDAGARAPAFGVDSVLEPDFPLSAKTGTSVGWRDNWAVGITPQVTVGVWVGNFDAKPMSNVSGITGAAPILRQLVELVHTKSAAAAPHPEGIEDVRICPLSGLLVGDDCPGQATEHFLAGTEPIQDCHWHKTIEVDRDGALASGCPGAMERLTIDWPPQFLPWAAQNNRMRIPTRNFSCGQPVASIQPSQPVKTGILWPRDGLTLFLDSRDPSEQQALHLQAAVPSSTEEVVWKVDGAVIGRVKSPFSVRWVPKAGAHQISLEVGDKHLDSVQVWISSS
jgi:penicillin-binding protein 1C